jgi:hypothetical protein
MDTPKRLVRSGRARGRERFSPDGKYPDMPHVGPWEVCFFRRAKYPRRRLSAVGKQIDQIDVFVHALNPAEAAIIALAGTNLSSQQWVARDVFLVG